MAVPGRRSPTFLTPARSPLRPALLVAAVLAALVVGLVLIGSNHTSDHEARTANLAYIDQVRPIIDASNDSGKTVLGVRDSAMELDREALDRQLARVAGEADQALQRARQVDPPAASSLAHDLLLGALAGRAGGVRTLRDGMALAVDGEAPSLSAVQSLVDTGRDLVAADGAYRLFARNLPPDSPRPPESQWITDSADWTPAVLGSFVTSVRNSQSLAPVRDLGVLLAAPEPGPVGKDGQVSVLAAASEIRVVLVVANQGNTPERSVQVVLAIQLLDGSPGDQARDTVDLAPGQRRAVTLRPLRAPQPGEPFTISARLGPVEGDANPMDDELVARYVIR